LNRSATRSGFEEEREHDRLSLVIAEAHWTADRSESGCAGHGEVGSYGADLWYRRRSRRGLLLRRGASRQNGEPTNQRKLSHRRSSFRAARIYLFGEQLAGLHQ